MPSKSRLSPKAPKMSSVFQFGSPRLSTSTTKELELENMCRSLQQQVHLDVLLKFIASMVLLYSLWELTYTCLQCFYIFTEQFKSGHKNLGTKVFVKNFGWYSTSFWQPCDVYNDLLKHLSHDLINCHHFKRSCCTPGDWPPWSIDQLPPMGSTDDCALPSMVEVVLGCCNNRYAL